MENKKCHAYESFPQRVTRYQLTRGRVSCDIGCDMKARTNVIMARFTGGDKFGGTGMHIIVEDDTSGARVLELWMSLEEFAKALTSSYGEAEMEIYRQAPIGKKRENKDEIIKVGRNPWERDEAKLKALITPYEVDGWKGDISDLTNWHRRVGDGLQRVGFRRYVEINEETE